MTSAERRYAERERRFSTDAGERSRQLGRLSAARVTAFVAALLLLLAAEWTGGAASTALAVAGATAVVAFAVLVRRHRRVRRERERLEQLAEANREARARVRRAWASLPGPAEVGDGSDGAATDHPYDADLDVSGRTSVLRLLSTVSTAAGADRLRGWLLERAAPAAVGRRQRAVVALAPETDLRQAWVVDARLAGLSPNDRVDAFLDWAEGTGWLEDRPWLLWTARLLPAVDVALMAAHAAGVVSYPWWLLGLVLALTVSGLAGPRIDPIFERVTRGEENVGRHAALLERAARLPGEPEFLEEVRRAVAGPPDAAAALGRLERLIRATGVRRNLLVHFPLQVLFLWDVHLLWLLERWQRRFGSEVRSWLDAVGRADAALALSVLEADHEDWCWPEVDPEEDTLRARELGHPLLPPDECVGNDVEVGPPGTFLLVTGSNMSGKSTLLRSVGLAAVLAQAGAPVPARRLRLPPLVVRTAMHVEDSLSEGISEFMAELRRMKTVVEGAEEAGGGPVRALYLLDEPLQGTNEAERREGLRIVLRRLVDSGALGAVATHDLRVHRTPGLESAADVVHLVGDVSEGEAGPRLSFDYRLKPGPAPSTNALALMRAVGLADGPEAADASGGDG